MPSNAEFFAERRAAAAFKHGILKRYPVVFASKAGSVTAGRVAFLDGYAGQGQYDDGSPGSPLLFVQAAQSLQSLRQVIGIFVEQDRRRCARLRQVLSDAEAAGVNYRVLEGDLGEHMPSVLQVTSGAALFAFLDPFGTALDRAQLRFSLLRRPGRAPTEALLHFSVSTVARIGGILRAAARGERELAGNERKTVTNVDRFLGGEWWQESFRAVTGQEDLLTATAVALKVADRYCRSLAAETGFRSISMPIRPAPTRSPKYILVLFTRHLEGVWEFAANVGRAGRDWQEAVHNADQARAAAAWTKEPGIPLFEYPSETFDAEEYERVRRDGWARELAENILRLLQQHGDFALIDRTVEVYGPLLGQAWEKHLRQAVKQLHRDGAVGNDGKGTFYRQPLNPIRLPGPRSPGQSGGAPASHPRFDHPTPDHRPSGFDHPTA
jgi:three-Cys-motif partner protein